MLVEDAESPFALTDKGTVREKVTLDMYRERIEKVYEDLESGKTDEVELPSSFERGDIISYLRRTLGTLLPDGVPSNEADLFEYGTRLRQGYRIITKTHHQEWIHFLQFVFEAI